MYYRYRNNVTVLPTVKCNNNCDRYQRAINRRDEAGAERLNSKLSTITVCIITIILINNNIIYYLSCCVCVCVHINNNNIITVHFVVARRRRYHRYHRGSHIRGVGGSQQLTTATTATDRV